MKISRSALQNTKQDLGYEFATDSFKGIYCD
jgi:hypothetical protein